MLKKNISDFEQRIEVLSISYIYLSKYGLLKIAYKRHISTKLS